MMFLNVSNPESTLRQMLSCYWDTSHCERNMNGHLPAVIHFVTPPSPLRSKYDSHCDPNPIFQLKKYVVPTFSFFLWYLSRHILADPLVRVGHVLSFLIHQSDPSVKENFRHGVKGDLTRPVEKTIWETRLKSFKKRWRQKNGALCNLSAEDWQFVPHQPILKEIVSNNTQVTIKIVP